MSKSKAKLATIIAKFDTCKDCEAVKAHFVAHFPAIPDGDALGEFYTAYQSAYKRTANVHADAKGKAYKAKAALSSADFANLVNSITAIDSKLKLSMAGQMLYVSGNTKPNKDALKALGLWWSDPQQVWYAKTQNADFSKALKKALKVKGLGKMVRVVG